MKHSDSKDNVEHSYGSAPVGIMDPPAVVLPENSVFSKRAKRLRELSGRVASLRDFLGFMARVALAQHQVLASRTPEWLPDSSAFELALEHNMAPLGIHALRRDIDWQTELTAILDALELHVGQAQRPLLIRLRELNSASLDALADDVLEGRPGPEKLRGLMPLVASALQVTWVRMTQALPRPPKRPPHEARSLCPCCGSAPVASVIHIDGKRSGVRYLHCGICATEWYLERAKCSVCDRSDDLNYLGLEDEAGKAVLPMQAETCGDCQSYLKIVSREWNAGADPLADDLASLALDLMLGEEGKFQRSGFNPMLIAGE
ncbi:formate dehydrogenase accessory protein FdhE [Phytohalomonas tamaricis]|uniref:formate dehydrogenase accessory protein FdhE n=1 Tax=Phytohalomonas tamaricis TaxID=2081032 RepID=UPI0021D40125|nr:formate dehydrogenase accessory protein FdhE [Phytohalomonas tamaricis]